MKQIRTLAFFRLGRNLATLLALVTGMHLVMSCSLLQPHEPTSAQVTLQNHRISSAALALEEMQDIDSLIELDNRWLSRYFESTLETLAPNGGTYTFRKLKTRFTNQSIHLESTVDIRGENGNVISAEASGEIKLDYKATGLEWQPHFTRLTINTNNFTFAGVSFAEASPEFTANLLRNLNADLVQAVVANSGNMIAINPVPLGQIQLGASLPGITTSTAEVTRQLRGVFMVTGAVFLLDTSLTRIALDLTFIPDLSTCPADVSISVAEFVKDVKSREPVGIARTMTNTDDVRYFYSVVTGAKRPLNIIHYWFADGLPATAEELPVGPSERWRTWSANGVTGSKASRLEVLVVEKESGCILVSKSIRTRGNEISSEDFKPQQAGITFPQFKQAFENKTSEFSPPDDKSAIALIQVRRAFLREVHRASLSDLNIEVEFEELTSSTLEHSAQLQAFDVDELTCEQRDCSPVARCKTNLTQCKRTRDTRDCSSCNFRNPLNNRCVSEAVDPLCEAARNRQNARYDRERAACISRAENTKRECEQLNAQILRSCQIESGLDTSSCEAARKKLQAFGPDKALASVSAHSIAKGEFSVGFSDFVIGGDLETLALNVSLQPVVQLDGDVSFQAVADIQPLESCIAAWSAPYQGRLASTSPDNKLLSTIEPGTNRLTAKWSGFGITIQTEPTPLESIFVNNPQLLANCRMGLTVQQVEQAISGDNTGFFSGQIELLLQPLPTSIYLAPATIGFGTAVYSADAELDDAFVQYAVYE